MQDIKEFYILCQPIDTKIGKLHFLKVIEYIEFLPYIQLLVLDKKDLLPYLNPDCHQYFNSISFVESIKQLNRDEFNLYDRFKRLFEFCFKADVLDNIKTDSELEYYRKLIKKINCINFERPNPNPEIEKFNMFKRLLQKKKSEDITFESIYTSVWAFTGNKPDDLYLYEMYALFHRISQFKNFDVTSLFRTVSTEQQIESWCKHINMFEVKEKQTKLDEFSKHAQSVMQ